ncbi:MAG TPA: hypothetical protein VFK43_07125, partial [Acidimicrobiales bacterium]|nr:hypothetical protein [Acidimicrobiales bacterium]
GFVDLGTLVKVGVAALMVLFIWRVGRARLGGLVRPMPAAPPPGELRKVKITFRCAVCGTEVRMTMANDEVPEPPRHCMDEMELVAPVME